MTAKLLLALVVLVWIPAAALVGGLLTREGRPLSRFVARHFRLLATAAWLFVAATMLVDRRHDSMFSMTIRVAAWTLCAAMFMPSLRHLERKTRQAELPQPSQESKCTR